MARSNLIKTATFTTMHITIAFSIVYLMTGSVMVGGAVALVEPLCNSVGYFVHERIWERLRSGGLMRPAGGMRSDGEPPIHPALA